MLSFSGYAIKLDLGPVFWRFYTEGYSDIDHAILRTMLKFLPWELSHFLMYRLVNIGDQDVPVLYYAIGALIYGLIFAYILTAIFTKNKQSLYDLLAGTYVVKR